MLTAVRGVLAVATDVGQHAVDVDWDDRRLSADTLVEQLRQGGYDIDGPRP
jgi:hypothetical protein